MIPSNGSLSIQTISLFNRLHLHVLSFMSSSMLELMFCRQDRQWALCILTGGEWHVSSGSVLVYSALCKSVLIHIYIYRWITILSQSADTNYLRHMLLITSVTCHICATDPWWYMCYYWPCDMWHSINVRMTGLISSMYKYDTFDMINYCQIKRLKCR